MLLFDADGVNRTDVHIFVCARQENCSVDTFVQLKVTSWPLVTSSKVMTYLTGTGAFNFL